MTVPVPGTRRPTVQSDERLFVQSEVFDVRKEVRHEDAAWLGAQRPDGKTNVAYLEERWLAWKAK